MNSIEFINTGGFPFELDDLGYMRDSYEFLEKFAVAIAGSNNVIVDGCVVTGSSVSAGLVIIGGKLYPFEAGTLASKVNVIETVVNKTFEDGEARPVYKIRKVAFSLTGIDWSSLKRMPDIFSYLFPVGGIIMWSGAIANIPTGWALCDGTSGTPNLKSRFIVGYDPADSDYDAVGKTGGAKQVALEPNQGPRHNHVIPVEEINVDLFGASEVLRNNAAADDFETSFAGGDGSQSEGPGEPHENRPPYYVLAFIIKL